jgi:hypothetical protein
MIIRFGEMQNFPTSLSARIADRPWFCLDNRLPRQGLLKASTRRKPCGRAAD